MGQKGQREKNTKTFLQGNQPQKISGKKKGGISPYQSRKKKEGGRGNTLSSHPEVGGKPEKVGSSVSKDRMPFQKGRKDSILTFDSIGLKTRND